jgi:hypothetical protein
LRYPGLSIPGSEYLLLKVEHSIQGAGFAIPGGANAIPSGATAIPTLRSAILGENARFQRKRCNSRSKSQAGKGIADKRTNRGR